MITDQQVRRLKKMRNEGKSQKTAADKSGMDVKTARKYLKTNMMPSQVKKEYTWRTRNDSFFCDWGNIKEMLELNPALEAKTIFEYLQREDPGKYQDGQLRTLQRRLKVWRATEGPPKEVFFEQVHYPGRLCQSDFTHMNDLKITINNNPFDHMLYHFVLTYSNWETGTICFSESFQSLCEGFQNALWKLGGVPSEHRTDRLSAAINNLNVKEEFTRPYDGLLKHYGIKGQKTQARKPHENGDVEQRHFRLMRAVDQSLMLRGSRNFISREEYSDYLEKIFNHLNSGRKERFKEELQVLRSLPSTRIDDFKKLSIRVTKFSTIHVNHKVYSVYSRLIKEWVNIRLFAEYLEVWYCQKMMVKIPRLLGKKTHFVQYRHVIDWLLRKPGAFENYRYKNDMFPSSYFRMAYDILCEKIPSKSSKEYLRILYLSANEGESLVENALKYCIEEGKEIRFDLISELIRSEQKIEKVSTGNVELPDLSQYDELLSDREVA